jgi:hypothetical protein
LALQKSPFTALDTGEEKKSVKSRKKNKNKDLHTPQ